MISWAWYKVRKRVIINNRHDICNKENNHAYDIIKHSRQLVINLVKMQRFQTTCPFTNPNSIKIKPMWGKS